MAPLTLEEAPSANGRSLSRCACWLGSLQLGPCVTQRWLLHYVTVLQKCPESNRTSHVMLAST